MRILVLGGTKFLGRWFVVAARARDHEVTLFNRGRTDAAAFPDVEHLRGDRRLGADGLAALRDRTWDAVFDPSTHLPQDVEASARLLSPRVPHYTYVSSISAYASLGPIGLAEDAPTAELSPEQEREVSALPAGESMPQERMYAMYGPLKARCERVVRNLAAEASARALVVRPGLIVGPFDASDRFTYWPARLMRGGEVLAPGDPGRTVQLIDVRDLAEWCVHLIEAGTTGTIQASGPAGPNASGEPVEPTEPGLTMGQVLDACATIARERGAAPSRFVWVSEAFLAAHKVAPWMELPLWLPASATELAGMMRVDIGRALGSGLSFRPLAETIRATLDWDASRPADAPRAAGLLPAREADLLAVWGTAAS